MVENTRLIMEETAMSLQLFTDSSANLPVETVLEKGIQVIPLTLNVDGEEIVCFDPEETYDAEALYERMRRDEKLVLKTSMINQTAFETAFEPYLEAGDDILYIAMSSGISGTYHAACTAAEALRERYPQRTIVAVDTKGASLGEGFQALEAAQMRDQGMTAEEIQTYLQYRREEMRQHFMVDDLMFLKRGGRIRGGAAIAGTIIGLKPIMTANENGEIVLEKKIMGKKKALATLAGMFEAEWENRPDCLSAGIAHGGCREDAQTLASMIQQAHPQIEFTIVCYEPGTGAHVGPGTVALFYWGNRGGVKRLSVIPGIRAKLASEKENLHEKIEHVLKKDR